MPPVDPKIRVQGEDFSRWVELRQSYQTRIRERHRPVPIALHKRAQIRLLFLHRKRYPNDSALKQVKNGVRVAAFPLQEKRRLGKNRLARKEGRLEPFPLRYSPCMVRKPTG